MLINDLKKVNVIKEDGSFNPRAGMSLSKNPDHAELWKRVLRQTIFLNENVPVAQRVHAIVNGLNDQVLCKTCNVTAPAFVSFNQGYKTFCGAKCAQSNNETREKAKNTNIKKYGSHYPCGNKEVDDKRRSTCNSRYGSDTPFENAGVQQKVRDTILLKYNVRSTASVPEVLDKQKQTRMNNIGVEFPFQSKEIQSKVNDSHLLHFGSKRFSQTLIAEDTITLLENKDWVYDQHFIEQKSLSQISKELNVSDVTVGNYLRAHNLETQHFFHSSDEKEILAFVQGILPTANIISNDRNIISPQELDIFLPEYNLAIEYCGLYWHSAEFKDRNYHYAKYKACLDRGIRLITIFEDEWLNSSRIVENKLKTLLNVSNARTVYARKTKVIPLTKQLKDDFFNANHIQGTGPGSVSYGLEYEGELVAAMTFTSQAKEFVLNRYATSCRVPGGFSKLLHHFQQNHEWEILVSFADLRWSNGNLYDITGWTLDKVLPPDYYWCKNGKRHHKFGFRHKHLPNKIKNYNSELSEAENCRNNGYVKIFNCGLKRYVLSNTK